MKDGIYFHDGVLGLLTSWSSIIGKGDLQLMH